MQQSSRHLPGAPFFLLFTFLILSILAWRLPQGVEILFTRLSFFILAAIVAAWGLTLSHYARQRNFSPSNFVRANWPGLATSFALTLVVVLSVKPELRVLSDEANLLSVSRTLVSSKRAYNTTMAEVFFNNLNPLEQVIPKRPLLFPFTLSLVHIIGGFRPENTFLLNYFLLFVLLFLVFAIAKRFSTPPIAIACTVLFSAHPIVSLTAASGSFDLMATLFYVGVVITLYKFFEKPDGLAFGLLWMNLLLLAHIRYESFIYFFALVSGLLLFRKVSRDHFKAVPQIFWATPLFVLPLVWQKVLLSGKYEHPEGTELFSLGQFLKNFQTFATQQFDFTFFLPYANAVNICALIATPVLVRALWKNRKEVTPSQWHFGICVAGMVVLTYTIFLSLFIGVHDNPTAGRYFLIFSLLCSLFPVALYRVYPAWIAPRTLLLLSVGTYFIYHPLSSFSPFMNSLLVTREARSGFQLLQDVYQDGALVVADRPVVFTSRSIGSVDFQYANRHSERLLQNYARHLYPDMFVLQRMDYGNEKAIPGHELKAEYRLENIGKIQVNAEQYLQLSRVIP